MTLVELEVTRQILKVSTKSVSGNEYIHLFTCIYTVYYGLTEYQPLLSDLVFSH